MNKLEVGMYVRTNTGIHKIFEIDEKKTVWKYNCDKKSTGEWDGSYEYTLLKEEQFIGEPSFNIIDLIEDGDYVNGYKVYEILEYENNTRAIVIGDDNKSIIWEKSSQYIKSIVTREMFEQMKYEVK